MRSHESKGRANNRSVSRIWAKLGLVALVASLSVALPQMFGAHAGAAPVSPQGFLFTVTTTDDHDDGVCNGTDCTLREAIKATNSAPADDGIDFAVTGMINLASVLPDITGSVTIEGPGAELLTVRRDDSAAEFRIFNVTTSGTVSFSGLTISNGNDDGGGILNFGAGTVNVTNSTVSDNQSDDGVGGGILNLTTGTVNVTNSTLLNNSSALGGGIVTLSAGTLNVTNSTLLNNSSGLGGGIFNSGTLNVINSTISGNFATTGDVGGIGNSNGTVNVINSTISGNFATSGNAGGIGNFGTGTVNVTNSTVSDNQSGAGGGILNDDTGIVNVTNSTISGNFAAGGGIFNGGGAVTVKSSIIALNTAAGSEPDVVGAFSSQGFNLIGKSDGSTGFTAPTDLTGTIASPLDPGLNPEGLQDNGGPTQTIALLCQSRAIDKGTSEGLTGNLTTDQRGTGFPRTVDDPLTPNANDTQGDGTDIGAFELNTQICNHPPVAQCRNIQVSAGANCQASITAADVDNGSFDPDPGDSIATRTLDNSGPFGLGPHTVTLTVTDTHSESSSCTATVTVVDTTPPTITCPPGPSVPAVAGQCQAVVNYSTPSVADNCSGAVLVGCVPPSGSTFQVGTTTVTCTARDAPNNIGACQFLVRVFDNQRPTITCPANISVKIVAPVGSCAVVDYPAPTVTDNCAAAVVCSPPSGSCFSQGTRTVTCTATDAGGLRATCSFTVTVIVFDICIQDEGGAGFLRFSSVSGDYEFIRCANGFTVSGKGSVTINGCKVNLNGGSSNNPPGGHSIQATADRCTHAGNGSLRLLASRTLYAVADHDITNNTCACP